MGCNEEKYYALVIKFEMFSYTNDDRKCWRFVSCRLEQLKMFSVRIKDLGFF